MAEKRIEFKVRGRIGAFPIDMLRYDCCWPGDQAAVAEILRERERNEMCVVNLRGVREPTMDRWASFGWRVCYVYDVTKRRTIFGNLAHLGPAAPSHVPF